MIKKEFSNVFRLSLVQGDVLLSEKMFDADVFNPFTRYSIDIRDILPRAITRIQKMLSQREYDVIVGVGRIDINDNNSDCHTYNFYEHYQKMFNAFPREQRDLIRYNPRTMIHRVENKTIRGVPCKIGLYINDNPIVERDFYVDGFNPIARHSIDVTETIVDIADTIFEKTKLTDIKNMWDDYDLINQKGLTISQIRELSLYKRGQLLRSLRR